VARGRVTHALAGDALALPFASRSVDVVLCSQLLHHFTGDALGALLAEVQRVARHRVIVSDLRRSWLAAGGFWLVTFPLRFHAVTRHDGVVSVLRGFTGRELAALVRDATGRTPRVRHRLGWRVTASWAP
jgi:SAM-dependent methyltransferase